VLRPRDDVPTPPVLGRPRRRPPAGPGASVR
jgi:hypothetical protein